MSKLISNIFIFQEMYREKIINNATMLKKFRKVYGISLLIFFVYVLLLMKRVENVSLNNFINCNNKLATQTSYRLNV